MRYSLIGGRNATKGTLYFYDPGLEILQTWDVSGLLCLDHEAQDGLVASPEGKQHTLLVRVPESMLKPGQHYFVLNFTDNSSDITKNHTNKSTLHVGQPIIVVYYQVEDTYFSEILRMLFQPNEVLRLQFNYPCPPPPNTLPLVDDINRDDVRDWDYPGDIKLSGTNYVIGVFSIKIGTQIQERCLNSSFYLLTIGRDKNNND